MVSCSAVGAADNELTGLTNPVGLGCHPVLAPVETHCHACGIREFPTSDSTVSALWEPRIPSLPSALCSNHPDLGRGGRVRAFEQPTRCNRIMRSNRIWAGVPINSDQAERTDVASTHALTNKKS